ncbi:dNA-binding protein [Clostridium sp. CAG:590]|nr:dNA-binding protein [Clostridium sp. CAG:590]
MRKNQFAQLLKHYLSLNGKTQRDLASALKFDKSTVSSWCSGTRVPKIDVIIDIANYLHVTPGDLITKSNTSKDYYYLNKKTKEIAQEIYKNEELALLFDAARDASPEDLQIVYTMLSVLKKNKKNK